MRNTINIYNTYVVFTLLLLQFINITNTCICNITFIQFIIIYSVTNIIYMSLVMLFETVCVLMVISECKETDLLCVVTS